MDEKMGGLKVLATERGGSCGRLLVIEGGP